MKTGFISIRWLWILVAALLLCAAATNAADMKIEAQVIWGTNDQSTDPKHKPVAADVAAKMQSLHLQWTNFFVVNSKEFSVPENDTRTESLSKNCEVKLKNLGRDQVELTITGRGKEIGKIKQALPKGELLVTGGNAENSTAWFVAVKQVK